MNTINNIDVATQIVTIPRRMHSEDKSPFALLKETGYFELHDQISEEDIRTALLCCPACIRVWMQYSEDQRSSNGWYFALNDEGLYETGHFDIESVPNDTNRVQYENAIDACAAFIKHEIESIRSGK
jgi:hypothetical protein